MTVWTLLVALGALASPAEAQSQTPPARFQMEISTHVQPGSPSGQQLRSGRPSSGTWRDLVLGQPIRLVTYTAGAGCGFVAGSREFRGTPTLGWRLEATPTEIGDKHVTVRLRWTREIQDGKATGLPANETTILLLPGDTATLDVVLRGSVPENCRGYLATLLVALKETEPHRPRVVSTDLWLVHRDPQGRELTQQLTVRGGYNVTLPFVFNGVRIAGSLLDIEGTLLARTGPNNGVLLEFEAERRWSRDGAFPDISVVGNGRTTFNLQPGDVTSVVLPLKAGGAVADPALAGHSLSLRLRSSQIR